VIRQLVASVSLLALAACSIPSNGPPPTLTDAAQVGIANGPAATIDSEWWRAFGDPQLDALVSQALAGNPSLAAAAARVRLAQSEIRGARAGALPHISVDAQEQYQRFSEHYIIPPPFGGSTEWVGQAQANLNWNLDIETFEMLPLAAGKSFLINFYDAGLDPPQYVRYTVTGSEKLALGAAEVDCWVLATEGKDPRGAAYTETYWISKKDHEFLKEVDRFNGTIRYKIRMPALTPDVRVGFKI